MKSAFKDNKGDFSLRKLMAVVSYLLLCVGFGVQIFTGVPISDSFIWVFASLSGFNVGAWTIQNLIMLKNGGTL